MGEKKEIKLGLIGVGAMGKKYAGMLDKGIEGIKLTAIAARSGRSLEWVKKNIKSDIKIYRSAEELIDEADACDSILIAVPHKAHKEIALRAFRAGKDVLCEKPAAANIQDAEEMLKEAESRGRVYGIMFQWRSFPVVKKFKELLEEGAVGKILRISLENTIYYRTAHYHASADWRSSWKGEGGGALINQGQHILDMWLWLFGMPESIYAKVKYGKYNNFSVEDEAVLVMNYDNNVTGTFILTTGEIPYKEELSVTGTKGKITMSGNKLSIETYPDSEEYGRSFEGNSREGIKTEKTEIICEGTGRAYRDMLENFRDRVLSGKPLKAAGRDGINALQLTVGAYVSNREKREISLPLCGELGEAYQRAMLREFEEKEGRNG